jgi:hypothetical protein
VATAQFEGAAEAVRVGAGLDVVGPIGDDLEQELGAELGEGDVADLVDGDDVVARPARQHPPQLELLLGLDQLVDQRRGGGEAHPPSLAAGGDAQGRQQVGLTSAAIADKYDRLGAFDVAALGQLAQLRRRDRRCLAEVELVQGLDAWQMRFFDAPVDRATLPILQFGGEQRFQVAEVRLTLAFGLLGRRTALAGDRR